MGPEMASASQAGRVLPTSYGSDPVPSFPGQTGGLQSRAAGASGISAYGSTAPQPLRTCYGDAASLSAGSAQRGFVSQDAFRHKINELQSGRRFSEPRRTQASLYASEPVVAQTAANM